MTDRPPDAAVPFEVPDRPVIVHSDGHKVYGEVIRLTHVRALDVEQTELEQISINLQVCLHFGPVVISIGCPFVLKVDDAVHELDPELRGDLGPLLALYPASLSAAYVCEGAELHLDFDGGASVIVPSDTKYEAWQFHDSRGSILVCLPGMSGEVAQFTNPRR